jgi:hypothetical protein
MLSIKETVSSLESFFFDSRKCQIGHNIVSCDAENIQYGFYVLCNENQVEELLSYQIDQIAYLLILVLERVFDICFPTFLERALACILPD